MLVDTSVWIDFLRGRDSEPVLRLKRALMIGAPVGLTGLIYQEILQGAETAADYETYRTYFGSQTFYHPRDPVESHAEAARLYFLCRRAGITLRSTIDCLIAQVAIEHAVPLLHKDRDFTRLSEVLSDLQVV